MQKSHSKSEYSNSIKITPCGRQVLMGLSTGNSLKNLSTKKYSIDGISDVANIREIYQYLCKFCKTKTINDPDYFQSPVKKVKKLHSEWKKHHEHIQDRVKKKLHLKEA